MRLRLTRLICLQFYSYLSQQQNMMQDYVRTSTYQRAMLNNTADFEDKVCIYTSVQTVSLDFLLGTQPQRLFIDQKLVESWFSSSSTLLLSIKILTVQCPILQPKFLCFIFSIPLGRNTKNSRLSWNFQVVTSSFLVPLFYLYFSFDRQSHQLFYPVGNEAMC